MDSPTELGKKLLKLLTPWKSQNIPTLDYNRQLLKLINDGADLTIKSESNKETALLKAIKYKTSSYMRPIDQSVIDLLIEKGSDVNTRDRTGATPLMIASRTYPPSFLEILLNKGARIEDKDNRGNTALIYACSYSRKTENIQFLIDKGANVLAVGLTGNVISSMILTGNFSKEAVMIIKKKVDELSNSGVAIPVKLRGPLLEFDKIADEGEWGQFIRHVNNPSIKSALEKGANITALLARERRLNRGEPLSLPSIKNFHLKRAMPSKPPPAAGERPDTRQKLAEKSRASQQARGNPSPAEDAAAGRGSRPWRRQEAPLLSHRRRQLAQPARWRIHREDRQLQSAPRQG